MDNLKGHILKSILKSSLQESSTFRDKLSKFLLNRNLNNLNYVDPLLFVNIKNEIFKNTEEKSKNLIKNLSHDLFEIFNQPDWLTLTRVLQIMTNLPTRVIDEQRLSSMYLKELKFTTNYQIDLKEFSKAMCDKYDPRGIKVFQRLNKEQKNIIEILNQEQIEALANLRSRSINFLSKIMGIPHRQRDLILSFNEAEIRMYRYMTQLKIHEILNYNPYQTNVLLTANQRSYTDLRMVYKLNPKFMSVIRKVINFTPERMLTLKNLLQHPSLRFLDHEGTTFLEGNVYIKDEEIRKFKLKNDQQKIVIGDLNEELRNALGTFDEHDPRTTLRNVLEQAIKLGAEKKDMIVLLTPDQLRSILNGPGADNLFDIAYLTVEGQAYMKKLNNFPQREERELFDNIDHDQRRILSKLYVLLPDGLEIIKELGPLMTFQTITPGIRDLNIEQQVLLKRIQRLSMEKRSQILDLSLEELSSFDGIFQLGRDSINYLKNLSKEGMIVLNSVKDFNADQVRFVRELSTQGISVVAKNGQLNPTTIESLRQLDLRKSSFLINLNQQQRHYLSTHGIQDCKVGSRFTEQDIGVLHSLTSLSERELLSTISALTQQELTQLRGMDGNDRDFINNLDPVISRLFFPLEAHEIHTIAKIFDWQTEEKFAFGLWRSLLDPNPGGPSIHDFLHMLINPISTDEYREGYLKFITGIVMAYRSSQRPQESTIVEDMANAIDIAYEPPSELEFYLYLLNYSIEDKIESAELEELFSKIPDTEFSEAKLHELCKISKGNVPFLFRWFLVNPIDSYQELSQKIIRGILNVYSFNPDPKALKAILVNYRGIQRSDVIESLRVHLTDQDFLLTHDFFFNQQQDSKKWESISKWLSNILTPEQQFEFLNSPMNHIGMDSLDVLEYSLFYDKGSSYPFFERFNSEQLRQLFDKHPVRILRGIVRNGHFRTLQIFCDHVGKERLLEAMRNSRSRIFLSNSDGFVFGNHRLKDLARTIKWFVVEDPDPNFYFPIQTQLALQTKEEDTYKFNGMMDILATNPINRDEILKEVRRLRPVPDHLGPACFKRTRYERSVASACIDSTKDEDVSGREKEHLVQTIFGNVEQEHNDLYRLMTSVPTEAHVEKLYEKIANLHSDSVDSEIKDVLQDIKNTAGDREKVAEILSRSNVATKIEKVAERTGLAFAVYLVGKHLPQGDLKSLGFDALNLWALPNLGSKVSEKLLAMGQRVIGPVLGRGIGNFGAFLGLGDSIRARKEAQDPLDMDIANINIVTNSVFILADIPALITDILAGFEIATGTVGEFAGPIGMAVSVGVIVLSESIEAALKLNNISKEIQLTLWEDIKIYFKFLWDGKLPDNISRDKTALRIYKRYISKIIYKYKQNYGMIGISLPPIFVTKGRYCEASNVIDEFFHHPCDINTTTIGTEFDYSSNSVAIDPFSKLHYDHISKSLPAKVESFHLVCGPREDDVRTKIMRNEIIEPITQAGRLSKRTGKAILMNRITEKLFIPQRNNGDCDNILLYKNANSKPSGRVVFHLPQDASVKLSKSQSMDVFFWGRNISVVEQRLNSSLPQPSQSKYYFFKELNDCTVRKEGLNFLVVKYKGTFACNLGGESRRQTNVAVVQGNFTDIENIHRIIGSKTSDRFNVSHSAHVDGRGGNDTIIARNSTTVESYYGDVIHGKTMTLLPMNVSEIYKIVANKFITVYNGNNESVQVDAGSFLQTKDKFLIYPMKSNNETHVVTDLYVHKHIDGDVVLEDELAVLERMKTIPFTSSKQITSRNYDITLSDNNQSIFHADRNNHNFYWEAADGKNHLYMFEFITANITISKAKGVLDFSQFYHVFEDSQENLVIGDSEQSINIGGLRVNLLNRQSIKVTFDGENYYDIKNGRLERDYCPYSFKIDGRLIVDGQELFDHHNCFEFRSDKIIFYRQKSHLLLSSGRNMLSITNFYPLVHENLDVSLKLNSRVLGPDEFRKKASKQDPFRFYEIIERGLTIYHNLPVDEDQIGVIHTNRSSIFDHDINFRGDDLLLTNRNGISVAVVDWKKYQEAREVMFAFNDTLIFNAQCVSSNCTPDSILEEFQRQKKLVKSSAIRSKRDVHLDSLQITGHSPHRLKNTLSAFKENVNLVLLFVQSFLDKKYPLPQFPSTNREEICAYATNITQSFQNKLKETGKTYGIPLKDFDCFELYSHITVLLKNEQYFEASKVFNSFVDETFENTIV